MSRKFTFEVVQTVEVELDETKFDEAFMAEFRASFFPFDHPQEHAEHIAQMQARGVIDIAFVPEFIEGYGDSDEMGIKARVTNTAVLAGGFA